MALPSSRNPSLPDMPTCPITPRCPHEGNLLHGSRRGATKSVDTGRVSGACWGYAWLMTDIKPFALVTGASRGIGFELAKQFAQNGFDLLVVAEDVAIADAERALQGAGGEVQAVRADLATKDGLDELYRRIDGAGRPLDAVALNAGIGAGGAFATDTDLSDELKLIDLNVRSTVHLAKPVVRDM